MLLPLSVLGPSPLGLGLEISLSSLYLQPPDIFSFILAFEHVLPFTNMFPWPFLLLSAELSLPFLIRAFEESFYVHFLLFLIYSFISGAYSLCQELGEVWGTQRCLFTVPSREGNGSSQYHEACALLGKNPVSPVGDIGTPSSIREWQRCWGELSIRGEP